MIASSLTYEAPQRYAEACIALGVGVDQGVRTYLVGLAATSVVEILDFRAYGFGHRGFLAILKVLVLFPSVRVLDLRGNHLTPSSIKELAVSLSGTKVVSVDLRDNDLSLAGPDVVQLVKTCPSVLSVIIDPNQVSPLFFRLVQITLEKKKARASPELLTALDTHAAHVKTLPNFTPTPQEDQMLWENFLKNDAPHATKEELHAVNDALRDFTFGDRGLSSEELHQSLLQFGSLRLFEGNGYEEVEIKGGDSDYHHHPAANTSFCAGSDSDAKERSEVTSSSAWAATSAMRRRPTVWAEEAIQYHELEASTSAALLQSGVPPSSSSATTATMGDKETHDVLFSYLEKDCLFCHLETDDLHAAVGLLRRREYKAGAFLYHEGDRDDSESNHRDGNTSTHEGTEASYYLVYQGTLEVTRRCDANDTIIPQTIGPGHALGSVLLLYADTYRETVCCVSECVVYTLHRTVYKNLMARSSHQKRQLYESFLQGVPVLKGMKRAELLNLADALRTKIFEPGEKLLTFGERGRMFYLIAEGVVEVIGRDEARQNKWVCDFTVGDCVGELEFLNDHPCVADVQAKTKVRVAMMTRHHFELVMGPVKDMLTKAAHESAIYTYYRTYLGADNQNK